MSWQLSKKKKLKKQKKIKMMRVSLQKLVQMTLRRALIRISRLEKRRRVMKLGILREPMTTRLQKTKMATNLTLSALSQWKRLNLKPVKLMK